MRNFTYETCCVNSDGPSITAMVDAAREIKLGTFRRHCESSRLESELGYCRGGLSLARDWHVTFYKSRFRGRPCYYLRHSAIEYVFTEQSRPLTS